MNVPWQVDPNIANFDVLLAIEEYSERTSRSELGSTAFREHCGFRRIKPAVFARPAGKFQASRLVTSWVNKLYLAYTILAVETPWAGCNGRGKSLGRLFWLRITLGER